MKPKFFLPFLSACIVMSQSAQAAPITFGAPASITADTDVSTRGSLMYAFNSTGAVRAVNGVSFATIGTAGSGSDITLTNFNAQSTNPFTSASAPFNNLSTAYKALLIGGTYNSTAATSATVTLRNLVVGRKYVLQIWAGDPRSGGTSTRVETVTSPGGGSQILDYNVGNVGGGVGQVVTGTFTADATTQDFTLATSGTGNVPQFNALQLRDVTAVWSGEVDGNWNETTANFSGINFTAVKALTDRVAFNDVSGTGAAVTNSNITLQTGGVTGANVDVSNGTVPYTFTGLDANGLTGTYGLVKGGTGDLTLATANTFSGTTALNGGTLTLGNANAVQNSLFTFNGGTLVFSGISSANFGGLVGNQPLALKNAANTAVALTTGSNNLSSTYSGAISGVGSLAKTGTGALTLSAANTFTGGTTISGGKIAVTGTLVGGPITLAGGDLDYANGTASTLAIANTFTQNSGKLVLDQVGAASDVLNVTNYTYTGGSIELISSGAAATVGTPYTIVNYTGTLTGTPAINTGLRGATFDYGTGSNSSIKVTAGAAVDLVWTGAAGGTWETGPALNWTAASVADRFYAFDRVSFPDSPTTALIAIDTTVRPGAMVFDNASTNYTLFGTGGIAGVSTLTKNGSARLTLATANTYTGANTINGGTVELGGTAGSLGTGAISLATGTSLLVNRSLDSTLANAISGAGSLTKTNTAAVTMSTASTFTGGTLIRQGQINIGNATALGTGTITLNDSSTGANNTGLLSTAAATYANNIVVASNGTGVTTIGANGGGLHQYSGTVGLNRAVSINGSSDRATFTGKISGNVGTITITGPANSRVTFDNAANDFTGNMVVSTGVIYQSNSLTALPSGTSLDIAGIYRFNASGTHAVNAINGTGAINIIAAGNTTLSVGNANGSGSFSGTISNGSNTLSLTKEGTGTQTLTGAPVSGVPTGTSSFTGNIIVSGGKLVGAGVRGSGTVFGAADNTRTITINSGATLELDAPNTFGNHNTTAVPTLVVNGGTVTNGDPLATNKINNGIRNLTLNSGTLTSTTGNSLSTIDGTRPGEVYGAWGLNGTVTSTGTSFISAGNSAGVILLSSTGSDTIFAVNDGTLTVSAPLQAGDASTLGGLRKTGSGTLILNAVNVHSSPTTINAGTLQLDGSFVAASSGRTPSNITVDSPGILSGTGSTAGPVTVDGAVAPGHNNIGTLSLGTTTFRGTGMLSVEVNSDTTTSDKLVITGNLNIDSAATLGTINDLGTTTPPPGTKFTIATYTGNWNGVGFNGLPEGALQYIGFTLFKIRYNDGKKVTLEAVTDTNYNVWLAANPGLVGPVNQDPGSDPDNDGRTNMFEFAFGLNPLNGGSVSPITSNLGRITGQFTYQRRDNSLTGLNYTVWTSTDLETWVQDTGAVQDDSAGPNGAGVESVTVTLSSEFRDSPKRFVFVGFQ